jgi:hypothetical protein
MGGTKGKKKNKHCDLRRCLGVSPLHVIQPGWLGRNHSAIVEPRSGSITAMTLLVVLRRP